MVLKKCSLMWQHICGYRHGSCLSVLSHVVAIYSNFCLFFFSASLYSFHHLSIETDHLREHFLSSLNDCLGVIISGKGSIWRPVTSNITDGSIMGLLLLTTFINDLGDEAECSLRKFADDTKPGGVTDTPDSQTHTQRDLDRLEK